MENDNGIEDGLHHFVFVLVTPRLLKHYTFLEVTTRTRIRSWLVQTAFLIMRLTGGL